MEPDKYDNPEQTLTTALGSTLGARAIQVEHRATRSVRRAPATSWDATVASSADDAQKAIRSSPENTAYPGGRPDTLTEEIKRRQISLAVRYVAIVRALQAASVVPSRRGILK